MAKTKRKQERKKQPRSPKQMQEQQREEQFAQDARRRVEEGLPPDVPNKRTFK
jgi:hypothetical protein